jgi:hypothetical protein
MKWSEYLQASGFPFSPSRRVERDASLGDKGLDVVCCTTEGCSKRRGAAVQDRANSTAGESAKKARHFQILREVVAISVAWSSRVEMPPVEHARLLQLAQERMEERGAKRWLCTPGGSGMHLGFPLKRAWPLPAAERADWGSPGRGDARWAGDVASPYGGHGGWIDYGSNKPLTPGTSPTGNRIVGQWSRAEIL